MALKIAKFVFDAMSKIFNQKREKFCFLERHFIKKVHIAAEERLKNTFLHRERVQGYNWPPTNVVWRSLKWFVLRILEAQVENPSHATFWRFSEWGGVIENPQLFLSIGETSLFKSETTLINYSRVHLHIGGRLWSIFVRL